MANPAPAPTPGATDPSVQSSMSVGDRRATARVAVVSLAAGSEVSEDPVSEPRSWLKMTPVEPHHGGKASTKLSRGESSSPRRSTMSVAESRHDLRAAPPAPCRLMRGSTERTAATAMGVSWMWRKARSLGLAAARLAWVAKGSKAVNVTCRIGSCSVICHPTQVNTLHLYPSRTGRYSIYLLRRDGRQVYLGHIFALVC